MSSTTTAATATPSSAPSSNPMGLRIAGFLFSAVMYIWTLAVVVYAVFFVQDELRMLLPAKLQHAIRTIEHAGAGARTQQDSLLTALCVDVALLVAFAVQHSVMARRFAKVFLVRHGVPSGLERPVYVAATNIILTSLFVFWRPLSTPSTGVLLKIENPVFFTLITVSNLMGWFIVLTSTFMIDHFSLFGIRQGLSFLLGRPAGHTVGMTPMGGGSLSQLGFYKLVRNPLMTGYFIAFWSMTTVSYGRLLFAVVCTAYIVFAIVMLEEPAMRRSNNKTYLRYEAEVPRFFPNFSVCPLRRYLD